MSTGHRKVALVAVVEPHHLVTLDVTCRTCSRCDLLIAHQAEVSAALVEVFHEYDPSVIEKPYVVAGTMDRADWQHLADHALTLEQIAERVRPFAEAVRYERVLADDPAVGEIAGARSKVAKLPESTEAERVDRGAPAQRAERETVPKRLRPIFDAIVARTDTVCREHLTDEYAHLCRRLAAALCRKRPSPVTKGRVDGWAAGVAHAIGAINFLFDSSQTPHLKATDLAAHFGVSPATASARASEIRRLFNLHHFSVEWCLPSLLDQNPFAWLISVDGIPIDARHAPRELQEEALRRGLIPYLPATHDEWDSR